MTPALPLVLVWPYALVFWPVFVWAFYPEVRLLRSARAQAGPQDAGSMRFIVSLQRVGVAAAFVVALVNAHGALAHQRFWLWLGVVMMFAGGLLRRHCFHMLGTSFTAAVVVTAGQAVVDRGAYRWIRHPSYTAGALLILGIAAALSNWMSMAVVATAMLLTYGYRVRVEERALLETLGQPYRNYMLRTKRFIPGVI
jgi:protein-S-isoprenylcysteine O-methyltransferase Ste14